MAHLSRASFITLALFLLASCGPRPAATSTPDPNKHYTLTGKIVSLDLKSQTATVDAATIPGFMEAMIMEYPVQSKSDLERLHPGDAIQATVNVHPDGLYDISNIRIQGARASK